ncbi:MAG TPA: 23S rRNA (cytosine(1962)-C(5))-methyltransferase RlmI, partial [Candidatus Marinimicrobia bacterium]|nr:23S rRNA (cytosine(1962)-C(5))-methyltransferase RlmI [Candidatus Neomarinimicrobiota bacterium]
MSVKVLIKKDREKSLLRHHPWLFSGAIERIEGEPQLGETVELRAHDGRFLGFGAWSPKSQIAVRIWSFNPEAEINADFFRRKLSLAVKRRESLFEPNKTDAVRLVNAESDGLPGLIVDCYNGYLVVQFLSAGAEFWRETIISALTEICPVTGIYERSDVEVREKEGLELRRGLLQGNEPPELIEI